MQTQAAPDDPLDREYQSLARKLRLGQDFCFIVYFVEDQRASQYVKTRLRESMREQGGALTEVAIDTPSDLATATLRAIFDAAADAALRGLRVPVWVEAFRGSGESAWRTQRNELLMRMNERRSRFESELRRPLILLLPAGAQREVATLAPDLWHVRVHSAMLTMAGSEGGRIAGDGHASDGETAGNARGAAAKLATTPVAGVPKEVVYWQSLLAAAKVEAGDGSADAGPDEHRLDSLSLWDGFAAIDAWSAAGRLPEALELANQVLDLARSRVLRDDALDVQQRRRAERDLAVARKILDALSRPAAGRK